MKHRWTSRTLALLLLVHCGDDAASTGGASTGGGASGGGGASATGGAGGQPAAGGSATGGSNEGGAGGATSTGGSGGGEGGAAQADALIGEWRPTAFGDSGGRPQPVPPDSPFFIFETSGVFRMGCGTPQAASWTFSPDAPDPALGVIAADFGGGNVVQWFVVELDQGKLTFVEGGDFFYFERDTCGAP